MEYNLTALPLRTRRAIREFHEQEEAVMTALAVQRQTALAKRNRDTAPRAIKNFGGMVVQIDAYLDLRWRKFYGPDYSSNADLVRWLCKRNPEITVKHTGTKIQIGWKPGGEKPRTAFHNTYDFRARESGQVGKRESGLILGSDGRALKFRKSYA